jgi:hypothetical protein
MKKKVKFNFKDRMRDLESRSYKRCNRFRNRLILRILVKRNNFWREKILMRKVSYGMVVKVWVI